MCRYTSAGSLTAPLIENKIKGEADCSALGKLPSTPPWICFVAYTGQILQFANIFLPMNSTYMN